MRVSLIIDGDSKGAVQAATDASKAVSDLGRQAQGTAKTIEADYAKAPAAFGAAGKEIASFGSSLSTAEEQSRKFNETSFATTQTLMQLPDIFQGIAGGQGIFRTALQQGGQLVQIYGMGPGGVAGSLRTVRDEMVAMVTPARLTAAGIVAVGAAAYGAYAYWKSFTLQLDDTARTAGTTTAEMSKLQAAASFKGISVGSFNQGIEAFAKGAYDAKNNMGGLAEVFAANNVHAKSFDDYLGKAADLIKNASSDQQRLVLLQQMGLPATMDWVRLLSGGADELKKANDAAADFAANDQMVRRAREFDEAWNRAWTNFALNARSAFQKALDAGATLFDRMERLANRAGNASFWKNFYDEQSAASAGVKLIDPNSFDARFGAANYSSPSLSDALRQRADALRNGSTVDPAALQRQIALQLQYVGILGQTATVEQQVLAVRKQIEQYSLTPGAIQLTNEQKNALIEVARQQALGTTQIKAQADAYRIEAETIGLSVGQSTAYTAAQNLLNQAKLQGRILTADNVAEIKREADAMGAAAQKAAELRLQSEARFQRQTLGLSADDAQIASQLRGAYGDDVSNALNSSSAAALRFNQSMLQLKNTTLEVTKGAFSDLRSQIQQGVPVWEAFGNAGVNALNRIIDKLADQALENMISGLFGAFTGGSGGSGLLSSLFGGGSKTSFATDGIGGYGPTFAAADGGTFGPGWGVVGERGAEIIKVHAGGVTVFPHHVSKPYLPAFAEGGSLDSLGNIARLPSLQTAAPTIMGGDAGPREIRVSVGVSVDGEGNIKAAVQGAAREASAGTVRDFVRSPQFTDHVARAYSDGKAAWKIR